MNVLVIKACRRRRFHDLQGRDPVRGSDLIRLVILIAFPLLATRLPERMMAGFTEGRRSDHDPRAPDKIRLTITARIGVTSAGEHGHGVRRTYPDVGGEVKGDISTARSARVRRRLQIIRPNEPIELEAKYALRPMTAR